MRTQEHLHKDKKKPINFEKELGPDMKIIQKQEIERLMMGYEDQISKCGH